MGEHHSPLVLAPHNLDFDFPLSGHFVDSVVVKFHSTRWHLSFLSFACVGTPTPTYPTDTEVGYSGTGITSSLLLPLAGMNARVFTVAHDLEVRPRIVRSLASMVNVLPCLRTRHVTVFAAALTWF